MPQGSPSTGASQLSALARMRADDVLPVPAGPAEEVGVRHPVVAHGAAQRPHDVVLAPDLVESPRPEAAVERDEGGVGHAGRAYPRAQTHGRARCSVRRPGWLRHPAIPAESCCLPTLTRFTSGRCAGPGHRTQHRDGERVQASGSCPARLPYTTRTAQAARVHDAPSARSRGAGCRRPPGPDHDEVGLLLAGHPGDGLGRVGRHAGAVSTRTDSCAAMQAELVEERLSRTGPRGRCPVAPGTDGRRRACAGRRSRCAACRRRPGATSMARRTARAAPAESVAPTTTFSNMGQPARRRSWPPAGPEPRRARMAGRTGLTVARCPRPPGRGDQHGHVGRLR